MQDERVRLSEQLAAVMAELRQATEASRKRQELNSQVSHSATVLTREV
jgi:hypothetical protein